MSTLTMETRYSSTDSCERHIQYPVHEPCVLHKARSSFLNFYPKAKI